jgi:hypothetical protein
MINDIKKSPFNCDYVVTTVSNDLKARIWNITNVSNWTLIHNFTGHNVGVNGLDFINEDLIATDFYSLHI